MAPDEDAELDEMFPLPPGVVLRRRRFGSRSVSPLVPLTTPAGTDRPPVALRHSDPKLGVTVEIHEVRESGHLAAHARCTDGALLNKGEVSVVLYGAAEGRLINRRIKLEVAEVEGCSGSADFGKLAAIADELGTSFGMVICLTV